MRFPSPFLWGAATAAWQIEGATTQDGRGESIWDRFARTGGVETGETGDPACDHYNRWEQDVALMAELGLQAYRFSIAWPRIIPDGDGAVNPSGLSFYRRLCEALRNAGIRPAVTLYHWDLPQALQDRGGWVNRETVGHFERYAKIVVEALQAYDPMWMTHNEPWCAAYLGHLHGVHAPGLQDRRSSVAAAHHLMLSHGAAGRAIKQADGVLGIALNLYPTSPATESEADRAAAWRYDGHQNRWFLDAALKGWYPADMLAWYGRQFALDFIQEGDAARIFVPLDFLGVNYYFGGRMRHNPSDTWLEATAEAPQGPLTAMGWEQMPDALTDLLVRLRRDYGDIPLYITENGAAFDATLQDDHRIEFIRQHLLAAGRAMQQQVNLAGWFVWSLLDNIEWQFGTSKRFGMVHVNYDTQRRTPKASALWYRKVILSSEVDSDGHEHSDADASGARSSVVRPLGG